MEVYVAPRGHYLHINHNNLPSEQSFGAMRVYEENVHEKKFCYKAARVWEAKLLSELSGVGGFGDIYF